MDSYACHAHRNISTKGIAEWNLDFHIFKFDKLNLLYEMIRNYSIKKEEGLLLSFYLSI